MYICICIKIYIYKYIYVQKRIEDFDKREGGAKVVL